MRPHVITAAILALPVAACAQKPMPPERQVALAVLPLPNAFRDGATVLGYDNHGRLVTLRKGTGVMICLATDPGVKDVFHVACYHNSLEPFMARRRELRAQGADQKKVDSVSFAEIIAGKLPMPKQAALWMLTGPFSGVDVARATVTSAVKPMYVVYVPFATAASSGLPDQPVAMGPWLMDAGTPKAHIMMMPSMEP